MQFFQGTQAIRWVWAGHTSRQVGVARAHKPSGGCGQGTQAIRWVWAGQLAIRWVWAGQLTIRWVWAGQLAIRWVWAGQLTRTCSSHHGSTIVTCTCAELLACYH